ncbi:hypothetical protein HYH02_014327 [Chlamydomonas schloesseri]|uniref:Wax synthase domain-containing protein n=1 Tax=Chlamydomonas schloesseri TaxID=2026947 RepID=A0A835SN24_9CHLO|nr:hypothetical protein HYH02_014327 [Chlamydomonas schloesseri]|eukprot:KAG2428626.1 hypothetical protein HYH02_014327 [Chlamydomonas schloesseri]
MWLFAIQYGFMADPAPEPRTPWSYFVVGLKDTFLPFEEGGGEAVRAAGAAGSGGGGGGGKAARGTEPGAGGAGACAADAAGGDETDPDGSNPDGGGSDGPARKGPCRAGGGGAAAAAAAAARRQGQARRARLERQPLAAAGASYPAAVARLVVEYLAQYLIYDACLTLVVKPLAVFEAGGGGGPPLFSAASVAASLAFTVVLYLHFTISYRGFLLALSVAKPELLWRCRHQFREPWLAAVTSVGELWQRWHQLFRMTFVRLAYRPTTALVRRLLSRGSSSGGCSGGSSGSRTGKGASGSGTVGQQHHAHADGRSNGTATAATNSKNTAASNGTSAGGGMAAPPPPPPSPLARRLEEAAGLVAVFTLSGIIHEYMCWAAFGAAAGWQLGFFLLHAAAILLEQALGLPLPPEVDFEAAAAAVAAEGALAEQKMAAVNGGGSNGGSGGGSGGVGGKAARPKPGKGRVAAARWRRAAVRLAHSGAVAAFCAATSVLFMRPWLQGNYHNEFWHPVSPVGWVVRRLRELLAAAAAGAGAGAGAGVTGAEL